MKNVQLKAAVLWTMIATTLFVGCTPMQPYYLHEDGDLSHYLDQATEIDFPDVEQCSLAEVTEAREPLTIDKLDFESTWDLTLEEAINTALHNSNVIRTFGAVRQFGQFVTAPAERLTVGPDSVATVYDVAIQETGQSGVEQILSNFDAVFNSQVTWDNTDRPQNINPASTAIQSPDFQQDQVSITNELSKQTAYGSQIFLRNVNTYTGSNNALTANTRTVPSDWLATVEAEVRQPLMRNRGTQINRIPVVLARLRTDVTLTQFESSVAEMLNQVERAYWELYFFYHNLQSAKDGLQSALQIWRRVYAKFESGAPGGEAEQEAQAREQYFTFRFRAESELHNVLRTEARLRYLMGLTNSDGRLIRPVDQPTSAELNFDWCTVRNEAMLRSPGLRQQKWRIKQRELELIAARNQLLPRVDAVALYRWLGFGDEFNSSNRSALVFPDVGSTAVDALFNGNHTEFRLGLEAEIPVGFRRELSQVRNQQLLLARERHRLEDMELETLHQLDDAFKTLDAQHQLLQTSFDRLSAAQAQVDAVIAAYDAGTVVLDLLLDAQRRRADAETAYYQALVEYNLAIVNMHFRKGSMLDYNNVVLSEGPWPAKAYFDAQNLARQRDGSYYLNYGYSRPNVLSRGAMKHNVPAAVQPTSYTGNPYPDTVKPKAESDAQDGSDEASTESDDEDEPFQFDVQEDEGDRLSVPPIDEDGRELRDNGGDTELSPPPIRGLEDDRIEAGRQRRQAATRPSRRRSRRAMHVSVQAAKDTLPVANGSPRLQQLEPPKASLRFVEVQQPSEVRQAVDLKFKD